MVVDPTATSHKGQWLVACLSIPTFHTNEQLTFIHTLATRVLDIKIFEEYYQKHDMECGMGTPCSDHENTENSMNIAKNDFLLLAIFWVSQKNSARD